MSRNLSPQKAKMLWGKAGNLCSICRINLTIETSKGLKNAKGQHAHINGNKPDSARYDSALSDEYVASLENHILLCAGCHNEVDVDEEKYTIEILQGTKSAHENSIYNQIREDIPTILFHEVGSLMDYLVDNNNNSQPLQDLDLNLTEISEKIKKNGLSTDVENLLQLGLTQAKLIREYFNKHPDPRFEERFQEKFVKLYKEMAKNISGDEMYYALEEEIIKQLVDKKRFATATAVIAYFFERCEIFKK